MRTNIIAILSIVCATSFADIIPPVRWDVETGRLEPRPYSLSIRRGESLNIEPRFVSYSVPISLTNSTIEMRYSAAYDSLTYYSATGTVQATTGRVQIAWNDSLNPTNSSMVYEIRATQGTNILARAYGPLTFLGGMVGINTGLTARTTLDWSSVVQTGGSAVLSNQMGSGATWSGSNWTFAAGSSGISADTATNIVLGLAYPLSSNPSNYCTIFAATNGLGGYVLTNDARLTDARAPLAHSQPLSTITNAGSLAYSNSLTYTDVGGASAEQGALADATATNTLDLAGTRAMTGDSVTLARDVKSRDAVVVGASGAAFGSNTAVGAYAAAFGYRSTAQDYGMASGEDTDAGLYGVAFGRQTVSGTNGAAFGHFTTAGDYGAAFGYFTTAGDYGAAFGYLATAGDYGFSAGYRGKGALGSFVFSDSIDADFDRLAYTNWFSVRAGGGTYFETPDLSVTGTVTATSFTGSGASLTSLDTNPSLTNPVALALSAVLTNDARYLASLTNTLPATNALGYIVVSNGVTYIGTGIVAGVTGAITNGQSGVTLGSNTLFAGNVAITGTSDRVQLSVRANGTQNSNVFEVVGTNGVSVLRVAGSGIVVASGNTSVGALITDLTFSQGDNVTYGLQSRSFTSANKTGVDILCGSGQTTSTNGYFIGVSITPAYNQTNNATTTNTDLLISRTETAIGSGPQKLIDAQVGGVSKFSVDNTGNLTVGGTITSGGNSLSGGYIANPANLLPFVVNGTATFTSAMLSSNAFWYITPTNATVFATDANLTNSAVVSMLSLDLFYNAQTFSFQAGMMTNTATLVSNQFNNVIFYKGYGATILIGK